MKCPNCGKTISDSAVFCGHCGAQISCAKSIKKPAPTRKKPLPVPEAKPSPRGKPVLLYVAIALIGVAVVVLAFVLTRPRATPAPAQPAQSANVGPNVKNAQPAVESPAQEESSQVEVAPMKTVVETLGGTWQGSGNGITITFRLGSDCNLGANCGTFEIQELGMSGEVVFTFIEGSKYEFYTRDLNTGQPSDAEYEYLELRSDGKVRYYSTGSYGTNDFLLKRID